MTGIAVFTADHFSLLTQRQAGDVGQFLRHTVTEVLKLNLMMDIIIATERYNIGGSTVKKTRQPHAERVIGIVEDFAQRTSAKFLLQNASDAKRIGSHEALSRIPGFNPASIHAHNAASQVYAALATLRPKVINQFIP